MASRQPKGTVSHPGRPSLNTITDDVQLTRFVLPWVTHPPLPLIYHILLVDLLSMIFV